MKAIKRILVGISIILFCMSVCSGGISNDISFVGWGISLLGVIISVLSAWLTEDD